MPTHVCTKMDLRLARDAYEKTKSADPPLLRKLLGLRHGVRNARGEAIPGVSIKREVLLASSVSSGKSNAVHPPSESSTQRPGLFWGLL